MGILPFFSTKQVPETAKRVKFSQLKHHMVGTRTGDEVNEGSPEEFIGCLRYHKLRWQFQS